MSRDTALAFYTGFKKGLENLEMAKIILDSVSLEYPVYNSGSFSLRHKIVNAATGGRILRGTSNITLVRALSGINLIINPGDRVGIVGHNGAGKTTLLRCISGIYQPTGGNIHCTGSLGAYLDIGAGLDPELNGFDNIKRLLILRGIYQKQTSDKYIEEIVEFSELSDFIHLPVRTYSSGMQMRLIFSAVTAVTPEIMVMDEFFGTGDASFQEKASKRLEDNIDQASILVFASHDTGLLKKLCNRICRLTNGVLEEITI